MDAVYLRSRMGKNFFDIFRDAFGPKEEKYETIEIELKNKAQELVAYIFMNEGALRERDRIVAELLKIDAPWVTYAIAEINKIPRNLPEEENK
jgi:hypothetical protein